MLVVRGTKKLRDRVRATPAGVGDVSTTALGDWFATALFWKPHVALLVNERTLLPVYMPLTPAATLLDRVPDAIASTLRLHGVDEATIASELAAMSVTRIAPTNNASIVGVMNGFAMQGKHRFGVTMFDLEELSLRMSQMITPLEKGSESPERRLAAVLGTGRREQLQSNVIAFPGTHRPEPTPASVYQLKVTLANVKPPVWRRVLVNSGSTLDHVHEVIQAAFGWWNYHLHEFEVGGNRYGVGGVSGLTARTISHNAIKVETGRTDECPCRFIRGCRRWMCSSDRSRPRTNAGSNSVSCSGRSRRCIKTAC